MKSKTQQPSNFVDAKSAGIQNMSYYIPYKSLIQFLADIIFLRHTTAEKASSVFLWA